MATVKGLISYLQAAIAEGEVREDWQVAVWIKDGNGARALDISTYQPDVDTDEGFIAFRLWNSHSGSDNSFNVEPAGAATSLRERT